MLPWLPEVFLHREKTAGRERLPDLLFLFALFLFALFLFALFLFEFLPVSRGQTPPVPQCALQNFELNHETCRLDFGFDRAGAVAAVLF
ncbi:hypothetical protein [Azonexus sp.]|uniref:hypothetical protein n=1 Tax=Azonexus sp. TaxID=1872668 RepID=UPI0039E22A16